MAVDTLKLYERLVKANVTPEASREIAEAISENASAKDDISRLEKIVATKEDIAILKSATKEDIAILKSAAKEDIANLKTEIGHLEIRLIKWMIGVGIAGFTALLGLLKIIKVI